MFFKICGVEEKFYTMLSICEERFLKYGQLVTKAIVKNLKYNLKTRAKLLIPLSSKVSQQAFEHS